MGRFLYVYETYIVFLGLPITLIAFTVLMMLYLNGHVLYYFYLHLVSIFCVLCIRYLLFLHVVDISIFGITWFVYSSEYKEKNVLFCSSCDRSSPMWFLSHFNSNLIFTLMKSDYVTRTQKESQSSVKFISNNEVVFTDNAHYYLLLSQIYIVYFGVFANLYLFNMFQTGMEFPHWMLYRGVLVQVLLHWS